MGIRVEFARVDPLQAVDVERHHFRTVRGRAIGKALDAACLAERVVDLPAVEEIFGEIVLAGFQREVLTRDEGQYRTEALAARAIAHPGPVEIGVCLEGNHAALSTAEIETTEKSSV